MISRPIAQAGAAGQCQQGHVCSDSAELYSVASLGADVHAVHPSHTVSSRGFMEDQDKVIAAPLHA